MGGKPLGAVFLISFSPAEPAFAPGVKEGVQRRGSRMEVNTGNHLASSSQTDHGVRPHCGQGQGTRLSHRVSFTPCPRVCCVCGCFCECGSAVFVCLWAVPVCVCAGLPAWACRGVCACVWAHGWAHVCYIYVPTYMHACAWVRVPPEPHAETRIQLQVENPR